MTTAYPTFPEHPTGELADELHAPRHAAGCQACGDMLALDSQQLGAGDGREGVLHVKEAGEVDGDGQ